MTREPCSVADQFCTAPSNLEPQVLAHGVCYICGLSVCAKCSSFRTYSGFKCRQCNICQVQLDGNDKVVMARMRRMAGY